jgi:hypothetical protein
MSRPQTRATVWLGPSLVAIRDERPDGFSARVNQIAERYREVIRLSEPPLSADERTILNIALDGLSEVISDVIPDGQRLAAELYDWAERFSDVETPNGVDISALQRRLAGLTPAGALAVIERVEYETSNGKNNR